MVQWLYDCPVQRLAMSQWLLSTLSPELSVSSLDSPPELCMCVLVIISAVMTLYIRSH